MNLFGSHKEVMSQEEKDRLSDKSMSTGGRQSRKDIDLFPALIDRKGMPMISAHVTPRNNGPQISTFSPASYDEAIDIVECLRGRAAATISLDNMRKADANRLVDFVAGASAAIDGDFHKMSEQVYLFCPSNFKIVATSENVDSPGRGGALDFLYGNNSSLDKPGSEGFWSRS